MSVRKRRITDPGLRDYTVVFKRAKLGTHAWTDAPAYYADYVSRRYRPAILAVVPDAARRPWWAARFEIFEDIPHAFLVLPGRLSDKMLREVRQQLGGAEASPGMNREVMDAEGATPARGLPRSPPERSGAGALCAPQPGGGRHQRRRLRGAARPTLSGRPAAAVLPPFWARKPAAQ